MKKQSFATGAALLAVAIGLGKIFSAIFKIPLDNLFLHAEGMAIFNSSYNVYMLFFAIATAGIPMAISSLIASAKDQEEENSVLSTALISIQGFLIVSGIVIFLFSDAIASFTGMPDASLSFKIMAPSLLFCGMTASLRGFFQGKRIMTPSALSQVLDSFGRLVLGFLLVYIFSSLPLGSKAAAAMAGIPFGALLSAGCLLIAFFKSGNKIKFTFSGKVFKNILFLALPITLTSSLHQIFNMADTISVVPFLELITENARVEFGNLSRAAMLYALPVSIASAVSSSILPAVSENISKGDYNCVNKDTSLAIRLAIMISAPCTAGFMAISRGIFNYLYADSSHHFVLIYIAPAAIFLSVGGVLSCILQGMGKTRFTVLSAAIAVLSKFILNPALMYFMGVNGAALSTCLAYATFTVILLIFIIKLTPIRFKFTDILIKPLICTLLCFFAAFFTSMYCSTTISILAAATIYIPFVFITRFISVKEFKQIFAG